MKHLTILICCYFLGTPLSTAQMSPYTFGKGFRITSPDSTFYLRFGFRFQNLIETTWKNTSDGTDFSSNFLIRRSRIKFDGYAFTKSLSYKAELGLSNRDIGSSPGSEFNNASNLILDAYIEWEFAKNWNLKFGQFKLPGNRERVISSANLQLVDRSRLNSRFNLDRDFSIELNTEQTLGSEFILRELFTFSQGEGRNVTSGHHDGFSYTWRAELLPFGSFGSKGDYSGSSLFREPTPKLSLGASYNLNKNAVRERGQLGSFIISEGGDFIGKDLKTVFIDMMFKYQGLSIMGEFADKSTGDSSPLVFDRENNLIGTFYTGSAITFATGYILKNNVEFVCRYTQLNPDKDVGEDESRFTVGLNKFFVGHSLKVQTDVSRIQVVDGDNSLVWRLQMDFHF